MTTGVAGAASSRAASAPLAVLTAVAGCVALVARPSSGWFTAITVAVGLAGGLLPVATGHVAERDAGRWFAAVATGVGAFALARGALGGSLIPQPPTSVFAAAVAVAAAEEAFFRRSVYGASLRWGVPAALAVSSFTFAIVHVTFWGWRAFPVDLAAGFLFGWQRWATGSWTAAAATHAAANVLMLL